MNARVQYVHLLQLDRLSIHTGDCIVLCVARNAGVQYVHLDRLSIRTGGSVHCSLCSQECWSTIYKSPDTPGRLGIHTGDCIVLSVARNAGVQYVHLDRFRYPPLTACHYPFQGKGAKCLFFVSFPIG